MDGPVFIWINTKLLGRGGGSRWGDTKKGGKDNASKKRMARKALFACGFVILAAMMFLMMAAGSLNYFAGALFHLPVIKQGLGVLTSMYCNPDFKKAADLLSEGGGGLLHVVTAPLHFTGHAIQRAAHSLGNAVGGPIGGVVSAFGDAANATAWVIASPFDVVHMGLDLAKKFHSTICDLRRLADEFDRLGLKDKFKQKLLCSSLPKAERTQNTGWCIDDNNADRAKKVPDWLVPIYKKAADQYQVPWQLLAAINWNDTSFGQLPVWKTRDPSNRGQVGWIPLTREEWAQAKVDAGNIAPSFNKNPFAGALCPDPEGVDLGGGGFANGGAIITGTQSRVLTREQVAQLVQAAGLPSIFVDIAYAESSFKTDAHNPFGATGLFQILHHPDLVAKYGDMRDPWNNARAAKDLLDGRLSGHPRDAIHALYDWESSRRRGNGGGWGQHLTPGKAAEVLSTPRGTARAATSSGNPSTVADAGAASLEQLAGQHVMGTMSTDTPSSGLLAMARKGQIGGVIIMGSHDHVAALRDGITKLQAAAAQGGNPPLLIAIDQEGGSVSRLAWQSAKVPAASTLDNPDDARAAGVKAGHALNDVGANLDLGPVLDVGHDGYLGGGAAQRNRTFGSDAKAVSDSGVAWLRGLQSVTGVNGAVKHFPGLGHSRHNTDTHAETIDTSTHALHAEMAPFRAAINGGAQVVMVSNATYAKLDPDHPAPLSSKIIKDELRRRMSFSGVVMTDEINTPGTLEALRHPEKAVRAGVDVLLAASDNSNAVELYQRLLAAAKSNRIDRATLEAGYSRVLKLKNADSAQTTDSGQYGTVDPVDTTGWFVPDGVADPCDPVDSIFTLAHWLHLHGVESGSWEAAVKMYNKEHSNIFTKVVSGILGGHADDGKLDWPTSIHTITSPWCESRPWEKCHPGMDIGVPMRTPVHAAAGGKVVLEQVMSGYGNYMCIQHTPDLGTCYAHLSKFVAHKDKQVKQGELIAYSGNTTGGGGHSTAPHLHFEVRKGGVSLGGGWYNTPQDCCAGQTANPADYLSGASAGSGPQSSQAEQQQGTSQPMVAHHGKLYPNKLGKSLLDPNQEGLKPNLHLNLHPARQPSAASCTGPESVPSSFADLVPAWKEAGNVFGFQYQLLEALTYAETHLGCKPELGWTKIPDAVWDAFGVDANGNGASRYDSADAIMTTARYLRWMDQKVKGGGDLRLMLAGYHQQYGNTGTSEVARYVAYVINKAHNLGATDGPVAQAMDDLIGQALQDRNHTLDPITCQDDPDYVSCIARLYGKVLEQNPSDTGLTESSSAAGGCLNLNNTVEEGGNPYARQKAQPVTDYPLGKKGNVVQGPGVGTHSFHDTPNNWESDNAVDIRVPSGTEVRAVDDGQIVRPGPGLLPGHTYDPSDRFAGARINLRTQGNEWYYAHLKKFMVHAGQHVKAGQLLGYSGAANNVEHLHLGAEHGDPLALLGNSSGCGDPNTQAAEQSGTTPGSANAADGKGVRAAIRYAANRKGSVAFAYLPPDKAPVASHGNDSFSAHSLIEPMIAVQWLRQHADRDLTAGEQSSLSAMLEHDDDNQASALYRQIGREAGLQQLGDALNLRHFGTAPRWQDTQVTPLDMLQAFLRLAPMTPARHRDALTSWMASVGTDQAWGIPESWDLRWHFKGGEAGGAGHVEADQCGWASNGNHTTALCVMTSGQPSSDYAHQTVATIAQILARGDGGTDTSGTGQYGPYGAHVTGGGSCRQSGARAKAC